MPCRGRRWLCLFSFLLGAHDSHGNAHALKGLHVSYMSLSQRDAERHGQHRSRLIVVARYREVEPSPCDLLRSSSDFAKRVP